MTPNAKQLIAEVEKYKSMYFTHSYFRGMVNQLALQVKDLIIEIEKDANHPDKTDFQALKEAQHDLAIMVKPYHSIG